MQSFTSKKFRTEGEIIKPCDYFKRFNVSVKAVDSVITERLNEQKKDLETYKDELLNLLGFEGEPKPIYYPLNLSAREFKCDSFFLNCGKKKEEKSSNHREEMKERFSMFYLNPKYEHYQFIPRAESSSCVKICQPLDNLLFVIKVYLPFSKKSRNHQIRIMQEIQMLGHQTLKDLLEAINCYVDYCGLEDVSERIGKEPIGGINKMRKDMFPASFFFINKTFYRHKRFVDNTKDIRQWLEQNDLKCTETASLDVQLQHLELQTGRPYLYQHQGDCEHVLIISDIRYDCCMSKTSLYPYVSALSGILPRNCMLCGHSSARWLVTNFWKLTLARAFLCHRCLLSYCYVDGRKAGNFKVFQYVDAVAIL